MARKRKNPAIETLPHPDGGWGNKVEGSSRFANRQPKKEQAQKVGREMAIKRKTEHVIKKLDGKIGEKNSYGADRFPPRG